MMEHRTGLPVLSTNGRTYSNTPVGRSISINSSSSCAHRIFLASSCSNFVSPFHLPLKKIKPEPWQRLFEGKKQQDLLIKKNTPNIDETINEDFINLLNERSLFDENSHNSFPPAPLQLHIDHLYEQIDDLTLQLSEERSKHKQTRNKAKETHANQLKDQEKQFQELLQQKLVAHQNELKELENKYFKSLNEVQTHGLEREEQLRNELEFVKKSFHTYKVNLDKENAEQLQIKINQALATMKEKVPQKEEKINRRINGAIMKERKHINERQKIEIENIKKEYQKEIDTILKTFTDSTIDQQRLESLNKELTLTKLELNETKERTINLSARLKDLEIQHIKTTQELNDYRMRFDEKPKEIEKLSAKRVDQLK